MSSIYEGMDLGPNEPSIYISQAGENGPVKIGFSSHVQERLSLLQTDQACEVKVLAIIPGTIAQEQELPPRV